MRVLLPHYAIVTLVTVNVLLFISLSSIIDVAPPVRIVETHTSTVLPSGLENFVPHFEKVVRRSDPALDQLFGPSSGLELGGKALAELPKETELTPRLIGVISNEENVEEQIVLLDLGGSNGIMRLRQGSKLTPQGWKVEKITSHSVDLSRGNERKILNLK